MIDKSPSTGNGDATGLREDEAVCEVTNLSYLRGTPNPHVDEKGRAL